MKIVLDEVKKDGVLVKEDGTEVSRYPYSKLINENFTFDDFKKDIEDFNKTLSLAEDFDNIKELSKYIKIHNW